MAEDRRPTNERILAVLEDISRQLAELRKEQERLAADLKEVVRATR